MAKAHYGQNGIKSLGDLTSPDHSPLSTTELAEIVGMSPTFIREEIKSGQLHAIRVGRGRKPVFRIPVREAIKYIRQLGLL